MNHSTRISYTLCGAVIPFLCAAVNAEEAATGGMEISDKILLMETINVTSNKEVAEEDENSGDPEVNQILKLVDSVPTATEESTNKADSVENDTASDSESDEANDQSTQSELNTDDLPKEVSDSVDSQRIDSKPEADQSKKHTE